ncbi:flagellar hook-basal body complex protein FliE [Geomicrobium sp. JCM 19039]|nr:flagellar hook-basal body complex protein FliE [Geomicrobium sp. JCM 19039]GAK10918.1 flagellar hook-basal body complex protein FliE [Geomicrobium sp. JCM 19039]
MEGGNTIQPFMPVGFSGNVASSTRTHTPADAHGAFHELLKGAIENVNDQQIESRQMTEKLVSGEVDNLHDVIIASEKAGIAMQTTIEVRNKAIEAYETIMRMQV